MNDVIMKLYDAIRDNPDLPVVCVMNGDDIEEFEPLWFIGGIVTIEVSEYGKFRGRYYTSREFFMDDFIHLNKDEICKRFGSDNPEENEELKKFLENVADGFFKKAILICVGSMNENVAEE